MKWLTAVIALVTAAACGSAPHEFAGYRLEPEPSVDVVDLPELTSGEMRPLRAEPGTLLIVYFGYTHCPDYCPTTLSDLRIARNRLDRPEVIQPAMVSVDPDRDTPVLADYVHSFFDDGWAFATDDPNLLAQAAAPFGVTYSVDENPAAATDPDADPVIVSHTTSLYAINDAGKLVLTWQFGIPIDDLEADLNELIETEIDG